MRSKSVLTYGGDDYVTKPFSPGVLMAKIKAHLRRVSAGSKEQLLELPSLTLDYYAQNVSMGSKSVYLSKKEFSLLSYMAQNVNRAVTVDALFQLILRELLRFGGQVKCWLTKVFCNHELKVFFKFHKWSVLP